VREVENRVFQVTVANDLVAEVAEVSTVRSLMQSDQSKWGGLTKTYKANPVYRGGGNVSCC